MHSYHEPMQHSKWVGFNAVQSEDTCYLHCTSWRLISKRNGFIPCESGEEWQDTTSDALWVPFHLFGLVVAKYLM